MNIKQTQLLMIGLILIGLVLISIGVYLVSFTDITSANGISGILTVAGLITGGLFISVPAKVYLAILTLKAKEK